MSPTLPFWTTPLRSLIPSSSRSSPSSWPHVKMIWNGNSYVWGSLPKISLLSIQRRESILKFRLKNQWSDFSFALLSGSLSNEIMRTWTSWISCISFLSIARTLLSLPILSIHSPLYSLSLPTFLNLCIVLFMDLMICDFCLQKKENITPIGSKMVVISTLCLFFCICLS
ncbi:hypothetical protein I3760_05G206700 [Carya illinoinensis]|nr:hypothetical protein I3760_05G206700 [Carya illinoinensis]